MLGREILGTVTLGRRLLLVAEIAVRPDGPLIGRPVADVSTPGLIRLIAIRSSFQTGVSWSPSPGRVLTGDDRVIVVATRPGLAVLMATAGSGSTPRSNQDPRDHDVATVMQP